VKPLVAVSLGDPSGIGPEVVVKALRDPRVLRVLTPRVFGDAAWEQQLPKATLVAVSALAAKDRVPGKPTRAGALAQLAYVNAAVDAVMQQKAQAICTAPVSKEQILKAGVHFVGHTELLAEAFGCEVLMLMDGPRLRVALATNHVPLRRVAAVLTSRGLVEQLALLDRSLRAQLGRAPKLAVCAVNPHAGEGGEIGDEDQRIVAPAVQRARKRGIDAHGPFPADGLFASAGRGKFPYDAALAMFHDQGLVPAKLLDFQQTVNVTLGLPVPRTSPDHGVAYDIAGQGKADPEPMVRALFAAAMRC
jgi:4-hydroxythreonine-4-phosphate dehydrogenase